jgi:hypothetical protein
MEAKLIDGGGLRAFRSGNLMAPESRVEGRKMIGMRFNRIDPNMVSKPVASEK